MSPLRSGWHGALLWMTVLWRTVLWMAVLWMAVAGSAWAEDGDVPPKASQAALEAESNGDLYVAAEASGAKILLDGENTNERTPAWLRGLSAGEHVVVVRSRCQGAKAKVTVHAGLENKIELNMVEG